MSTPWYAHWFNTPYYHDLYKHRDDHEALRFIKELCTKLHVKNGESALDMACGRGRHARVLSELGLRTVGVDLSPESIDYARQFEHKHLRFEVGNMLKELPLGPFDWVMNLFTSFGYFEDDTSHELAIKNMANTLKPNGRLVMDFMNTGKITENLIPDDVVHTDMATYQITRKIEKGYIVKNISVNHNSNISKFEERVRAFSANDFKNMLEKAGLDVVEIAGDYDLSSYSEKSSNRMVIIAKKSQ
jgi:SAM-dependent methyltransferase|tara:strand:- start:588 stop:1322 length:735 start_codon:yes stop_codon:yes gene_type:complete